MKRVSEAQHETLRQMGWAAVEIVRIGSMGRLVIRERHGDAEPRETTWEVAPDGSVQHIRTKATG